MSQCIAERTLVYSAKESDVRRTLVIRVFAPRRIESGMVNFQVADGTAGCTVVFDGLPEESRIETYGADSLQALQLAADIEPTLKRLSKKYDFFFPTGESYFEE